MTLVSEWHCGHGVHVDPVAKGDVAHAAGGGGFIRSMRKAPSYTKTSQEMISKPFFCVHAWLQTMIPFHDRTYQGSGVIILMNPGPYRGVTNEPPSVKGFSYKPPDAADAGIMVAGLAVSV